MALSCVISEIMRKSRFFHPPPPAFDPHVRVPRCNIAIRFGVEKLEWFDYPVVKKTVSDYVYWFVVSTQYTNVTDTQTDRQTLQ